MPRISRIYEFDDDYNTHLGPNYTRNRSASEILLIGAFACYLSIYLTGEEAPTSIQLVSYMYMPTCLGYQASTS